jgi:CheY-like chemotaxis protein
MIIRATPKADPRHCLLYIEDHAENVAPLEALLALRKDVQLVHAADVSRGIKLARARRPEVILIDVDLPGPVHGSAAVDYLKQLRADPATQGAPVLALSANVTPETITRGLEAGYFLYLATPLQAVPLTQALDFALEFAAVERAEQ